MKTYETTTNHLDLIAEPLPDNPHKIWTELAEGVYFDTDKVHYRNLYYLKTGYDLVPFEVCDNGICDMLDGPYGACDVFAADALCTFEYDDEGAIELGYEYTNKCAEKLGFTFN